MKSNILFPFYLENSSLKSQSIAVELAKNLNVDLHLLVIFHNNDFLYNEYQECSNSKDEFINELFDNLKKNHPDIILGNDKPIGVSDATTIYISFENYADHPLKQRLSENYLWIFDYDDFYSIIIPTGFIHDLNQYEQKVWVISKNQSGILTQTKHLIDKYDSNTSGDIYWDSLPLDLM